MPDAYALYSRLRQPYFPRFLCDGASCRPTTLQPDLLYYLPPLEITSDDWYFCLVGKQTMSALLGCIADNLTCATDMAGTLTRAGMRTMQMIGVPNSPPAMAEADAIVIALISRTIPADQAISQSIDALNWEKIAGYRQSRTRCKLPGYLQRII